MKNASTETKSTDWGQRVAEDFGHSVQQLDFFQAIRRIESMSNDLPRVGHARKCDHEPLRIRQTNELNFAPATIDQIDTGTDGRAHLSQRFFGLLGPGGPLPLHFTETVRSETRHESDPTLEAFLNLFHHRMAMFFYRAWSSSRGAIQHDRPKQDRFASYVGSICGELPSTTDDRHGKASRDSHSHRSASGLERLFFSGRFGSSHRNAEGLSAIVSATVKANAEVQTFQLKRLLLEPEDRTLLSPSASSRGRGGRLGQSVVLGRSVPDRRSLVNLDIGPMSFDVFQQLLPGASGHHELRHLVRSYIDPGLDCRVRLILDRFSIPKMSLARTGSSAHIGSLGRSAWMSNATPTSDARDCQFII